MNDHDRENLKFLLMVSPESLNEWFEQASSDDIEYALEIINAFKAELIIEMMEMQEINYLCDDDMKEANILINRIKNGNS